MGALLLAHCISTCFVATAGPVVDWVEDVLQAPARMRQELMVPVVGDQGDMIKVQLLTVSVRRPIIGGTVNSQASDTSGSRRLTW